MQKGSLGIACLNMRLAEEAKQATSAKLTFWVPNQASCSAREDDGKRVVVVSSMFLFALYGLLCRSSMVF